MSYRFSEFPARQLYAFATDATTGVNARCVAINADVDDGTDLPESWYFPQFQPDRGLYLPMCLIEWQRDMGGPQMIDDAPYRNSYFFSLIMGINTTQAQLGGQAILKMRADRVLREMFDSTKGGGGTWDGHTAGQANGAGRLIGARIVDVADGPLVKFVDLDNTRAMVVSAIIETLHEESQSPT